MSTISDVLYQWKETHKKEIATFCKITGAVFAILASGAVIFGIALPSYHVLNPEFMDVKVWAFREGIKSLILEISIPFLISGIALFLFGTYLSKTIKSEDTDIAEKWFNKTNIAHICLALFTISLFTISLLYHYHVIARTENIVNRELDYYTPGDEEYTFWLSVKTNWLNPMETVCHWTAITSSVIGVLDITFCLFAHGGYAYLKKKWATFSPQTASSNSEL